MSDKNTESRQKNIAAMMKAESLDIVGISGPDRFGGQVYANLELLGYEGKIYGVNPHYETLYNQKIYPCLSDLPETPDCAILAVGNSRLLPALKEAANLSMRGRAEPAAVTRSFKGAHGLVTEFLGEEVLERQPSTVQGFDLDSVYLRWPREKRMASVNASVEFA